mmetsp:Transcript_4813/g.9394  ORF Transcript_4813/g.9394 Transcript_4813/m.9394 type:complete len:202 (+) Transcript_4813:1057-1662(+)
MAGDGFTGDRSVPIQHTDDTGWESCLFCEGSDHEPRQRGLFRRLMDDTATTCKRRSQFPCLHEDREIPGGNLAANPKSLAPGVAKVLPLNGHSLPHQLVSPTSIVTITFDREDQVNIQCDLVRLPVIQRLHLSQTFLVFLHQVGELQKEIATVRATGGAPSGKCLLRCTDRSVHISLGSPVHVADYLTRGRVYGLESPARD